MAREVGGRRRLVRRFSLPIRLRPLRLVGANLLVLTSLAATVGIAAHPAGAAAAPAAATAPRAQAATGCTPFTDNFGQDTGLSPNWQTNTPFLASVAAGVAAQYTPSQLQFSTGGMDMQGAGRRNLFTGIQSVTSCKAPFSFETNVQGLTSHGNTFVVYLVSANPSQGFSIEGNLNPKNPPFYGVFARNALGASNKHGQDIDPNPSVNSDYDVTMSVNADGSGTVTLSGAGVPDGVTVSVGPVGSGPFYVVLGQREGSPKTIGANDALWSNAVLSTGTPVAASLTSSSQTVAGVETVPASAIPAASVSGATGSGSGDPASAPLSSIPLSSIGLASSPLSSIPLSSIPLSSIALPGSGTLPSGIAAAQQALETTLLSDLSINYPNGCGPAPAPACSGWEGVLAGTSYENVPLQTVTLADVLENPVAAANLESVNLGALDLSSSPLSSIPLSSIELGATPLSSIGLGGASNGASSIAAWCAELTVVGSSCADFGINPTDSSTSVTLLSLALAGVPLSSIPLSSIPLSSIDLSASPLSSIPLSSINLASNPLSSIPLSSIPLSSIPLSSIPLSSISDLPEIVDCTTYPDCATATLGQAAAAGAILPTATVGELGTYNGTTVGQLLTGDTTSSAGYPNLTLGDLVLSTVPPATYQWQSVDLSSLPLAADRKLGGTLNYTATIVVGQSSPSVQVSVTLPPTFAYVPGSTELDGSAAPDPAGGSSLAWTLSGLTVGTHSLTFSANAGIGLGPATATLSASAGDNVAPSASATVDVVDGEGPQIGSSSPGFPLSAGALNTSPATQGDLNIGYLTSPGSLNDWTVTVPPGAELSLALSNLPATYDLELFGPSGQQLQGSPTQTLAGVTDTVPTITPGTTTESTPGSQDLPVTPPPGDQLEAISNNPDAQSQYIQTTPLAAGTYVVQVSGYNGAYSSQPYLLQANVLGGATAPSCPGAISYLGSLGSQPPASGPVSVPSGVNTLFLVDTQRLSAAFGQTSEAQIMTQLQTVASDSSAGVVGAVIPVDAYSDVQAAYADWNTNPCSVDAANEVVAAISSVVDQIRVNNPTVENLVIVGADDQIPFARVADGATQSNERDYGAATFAGENNVEADALSLGYYLSDDPYAASTPLGVGSATLYLPQLGLGRLVESASQIESALSRFVSSDGDLDANASLTTGYSFLTSGAEAVSANLASDGLAASTLINETWQESDLDTALAASPTPAVDSINAHFDFSRALPAYDNTNNVQTNLFTTQDVRDPSDPTSYAGRLLFSMGCHAGLDVDDAEVASSGISTPVDDWAKAFADSGALWIGNTGYGYADTDTVAYSAKLMAAFAGNLNGSLTIGEALAQAKQQYAAGNAILSPYDLKALMESTFYGLPMYHLNTAGTPAQTATGPSTTTDPATGLTTAPVSVTLAQGTAPGQLGLVSTSNGSYYQVNGSTPGASGTQTTEYRPIEPLVSVPVTEPNLVPHGALLTGLQSTDIDGFTPAYSMPAAGSANAVPPPIGSAAFPGTLERVASYSTFSASGPSDAAQLDLIAGQFLPNPSTPGSGTQRLFDSVSAQVFYLPPSSPLANDYAAATIDSSTATTTPGNVNFAVQVAPSSLGDPVAEVVVLYTDATNPGAWTPLPLTSAEGGTSWSGSAATTSTAVQYVVEAVDSAGNVAFSNNEGASFTSTPPPTLSISLSGGSQVNGFYTGPVTANITAPGGSTYTLDGSSPAPVPDNAEVVVSSSGEHTITVTDPDGASATQAFAISTSQTETALTSAPNPSVAGQSVTYTAMVSAATPGAGNPTGTVVFLDGTTPIAACGGSSGMALDGTDTAACQVTYPTAGSHQIAATYSGDSVFTGSATGLPLVQVVGQAGATLSLSPAQNPVVVGQSTTVTASVGVAQPGAGSPTGYVEFLDGSVPIAACGGAGGEALSDTGTTSCTAAYSTSATHEITATYLGDANFSSVTAPPLGLIVNQAGTTTAASSSPNPATPGQTVTYTATVGVVSPGAGSPTGEVEFLDGGTPISSCGGTDGVAVNDSGSATCQVSYPAVGSHQITAAYLGDNNFAGSSTTTPLTETVGNATAIALATSRNPSPIRASVRFTAAVQAIGGGNPTGNVEFLDGGTPITSCGGAAGVALSRTRTATCTVTFRTLGAHNIVAVYLGGGVFNPSTSDTLSQIVTRSLCSIFIGCNLNGLDLANANLRGVNLSLADLVGTNLAGADLQGANLTLANVTRADLNGANVSGAVAIAADFRQASMAGTIGTGAQLSGADLQLVNLAGGNFTDAALAQANLRSSNLTNTNFTDADLQGAYLQGAVLANTNFTGANLKGAHF